MSSKHRKYPVRIPHFAAGIRAQASRSGSRRPWWERRWTAALEAMHLGTRLGRGKAYALSGQVTSLRIEGPRVEATIAGSRDEPYRARLDFASADDAAREAIVARLKAQPMMLARLLVDDLPIEVEEVFHEAGVALFPSPAAAAGPDGKRRYDIATSCSCPDWANPCKHLAAVLCLLGEEVARCPATLLALRGIDIDELLPPDSRAGAKMQPDGGEAPVAPPLPETLAQTTALLTRLGPIPFWRGAEKCMERLSKIYEKVAPTALAAAKGPVDLRDESERTREGGVALKLKERALTPRS